MTTVNGVNGLFIIDDEKVKQAKQYLLNKRLRDLRLRNINEAIRLKLTRKRFRAPLESFNHLVEIGINAPDEFDKIIAASEREFQASLIPPRQAVKEKAETNRKNVEKARMRFNFFKTVMEFKLDKKLSKDAATLLLEKEKLAHLMATMENTQSHKAVGRPSFWTTYMPMLVAEYKQLLQEKGYDPEPFLTKFASVVDSDY